MRKDRASEPISKEASARQGEKKMRPQTPAAKRQAGSDQRRLKLRGISLRAGLAVIAGRVTGALSRRLHIGGGTSIVGVVAQRVYPDIVAHLGAQLEQGSVVVSGTNGKTTTSSFLAGILRDGGLRVWRNREGSNLMRGIASSLVIRALPSGRLRRSGKAISIFEVDEAALPQVVAAVPPRVAVFTNLFRDQLDRYGEVDSVVKHWQRALSLLPSTSTLVLNADDPTVAFLGDNFPGNVLYYGIDDPALDQQNQDSSSERHQVIDTRNCPYCGSEYVYTMRFYSHMGHYNCPNCGAKRPQPDIRVVQVQTDSFDRLRIQVETAQQQQHEIIIPLPGLYNIYNALASITAARTLSVNWAPIISGIEQSKPIFGRGERIQAEGRTIRLLLAKNPAGFNEVLRTLFSDNEPKHILFILNDNVADGQDISWIWDVDFERMGGHTTTVVTAGTRALDLALRLKYAGLDESTIHIVPPVPLRSTKGRITGRRSKTPRNTVSEDAVLQPRQYGLKKALDTGLQQTPLGETLFVVPTYTGLLEIHRELEQRGLTTRYWEGSDA